MHRVMARFGKEWLHNFSFKIDSLLSDQFFIFDGHYYSKSRILIFIDTSDMFHTYNANGDVQLLNAKCIKGFSRTALQPDR